MNESDNSLPVTGAAIQPSNNLPDLNIYGYQVCEQLSEHPDRERTTYLARDITLDRLVVIKQWQKPDCHPSPDYANYLPEIDRLQQIDYLNIPRYLHSFATPMGFCVVRAYQPGISLAEIGELPPSDLKLVAATVLEILKYLHQLTPAIVHQNIKPENIIVNTEEKLTIYLVDFGIHPYTDDLGTIGTPGFIAPEQLFDLGITSISDIYSLGVSLICLLTGTPTTQAQYLLDDRYRPQFRHLIPADTDPQLITWLEAMVEPNPQQRFALMRAGEDKPQDRHRATANVQPKHPDSKPAFNLTTPRKKVKWLRWVIAVAVFGGMGSIGRQVFFSDSGEISPAQIAKNQSFAKEAAFAASDRGKLLTEKRCANCNLNYQNFTKTELTGAIVPQSSFIGANFTNANLTLASFRDADLSGANLSSTNLDRAAFYGAKLIGTNLVGANLNHAKLVYAKLKGAMVRNANFSNADLRFAELQQVDLTNANFTGADLSNADLSYANLRHAILTGTKLDGASLTGASMPDGSTHP